MIIKKLTATFGKLDCETLALEPGLNIISQPNEAGKSTWAEFWLALLYGVDTREQERKGAPLPVKKRCLPWNGKPMEGRAELQWNGNPLTVERSSSARAPMGNFKAYGPSAAMLTADNCGLQLVGVERSVYERSAFIRQCALGVSRDETLERRLSALVTTGDEESSYSGAAERLQELKNHCRHNKTGLLCKAEEALAQVERKLREIASEQERIAELEQQLLQGKKELRELSEQKAALDALHIQRKKEELRKAEETLTCAEENRRRREAACQRLPDRQTLAALDTDLRRLQNDRQTALMDASMALPEPAPPAIPAAFLELTEEAAAKEESRCEALQRPAQKQKPGLRIAAFALLIAGLAATAALLATGQGLIALCGLVPALAGAALFIISLRKAQKLKKTAAENRHQAELLLAKYGVQKASELPSSAREYAEKTADYQAKLAACKQQQAELKAVYEALAQRQSALLARLVMFAPDCTTLPQGCEAVQHAQEAYAALDTAQREEQQAAHTLATLKNAIGELRELPVPAQIPQITEEALQKRQQQLALSMNYVRSKLDQCRGRLSQIGEPLALEAEKEGLLQRLAELQTKEAGLQLALEALKTANSSLQSRFSPLLCSCAGEIFSRLTGGRYESILLGEDLSAQVRVKGQPVMHTSQALSCGTVDQLYLAIRLAISELLLPADAPLVLDDALMAFDDERAALALAELRRQAATRQILLFTCHKRELSI